MKLLTQIVSRPFRWAYDKMHLFTDQEAWGVYRFAAFVEAGIWGFFILTIIYAGFGWPQAESVVAFGRSVWGMAYAVYVIFILLVARSMEWRIGRVSLAMVAGIPPFGSLVFERLMGRHRKVHPVYIKPPKGHDE